MLIYTIMMDCYIYNSYKSISEMLDAYNILKRSSEKDIRFIIHELK